MRPRLFAALLLAGFAVREWTVAHRLSAVFDEIAHIGAGYGYAAAGDYRMNDEHPPVVKLAAGLAIRGLPVSDLFASDAWRAADQWGFGLLLLTHPAVPRWAVLDRARLPMIGFALLGGACLFALAEIVLGARPALLALLLYVGCPTIQGHGVLVHTDVPVMATGLLSVLAALLLRIRFSAARAAFLGLAVGLTLLVKFNAVAIVGVVALIAVWPGPGRFDARRVALAGLAVAAGAATIAIAVYQGPAALALYPRGFLNTFTRAKAMPGYPFYLLGRYDARGFWSYFPIAFALKTTLPALLLIVLGMVSLFRRRPTTHEIVAVLVPLCVWGTLTVVLAANIGLRYLIPAFPFLFALASRTVKDAAGGRLYAPFALGILHAASGLAAPDPIGYTNLLVDGPRAIAYLDDSNVDWGQGLRDLERVLAGRDPSRGPVRVLYTGGLPASLFLRGLPVADTSPDEMWDPATGRVREGDYAVSTELLLRVPELRARLHASCGTAAWLGPSMQLYCCPRCTGPLPDEPLLSIAIPPPPSLPPRR